MPIRAARKKGIIGNDSEEIVSLITELHERDNRINTYDDVMKKLEENFQKFPAIRDYIEYRSQDEYIPRGEPLLHSYTGLASVFACTVAVVKGKAQEAAKKADTANESLKARGIFACVRRL